MTGLDGIVETDDELRIGARATHRQIHDDPIISTATRSLHDVAGGIGDPQVRNWGTIGGSVRPRGSGLRLAGGAPRAHARRSSAAAAAGERVIDARDFFLDTFTTAIEPTEVLTEIRIPRRPKGTGGGYAKLERRVGDFATAGVAPSLRLGDGRRDRRAPGSA